LNSGLHTGKAGALFLEPHLQSIWLWLFWRWVSWGISLSYPWTTSLPISASQVSRITGVSHCAWLPDPLDRKSNLCWRAAPPWGDLVGGITHSDDYSALSSILPFSYKLKTRLSPTSDAIIRFRFTCSYRFRYKHIYIYGIYRYMCYILKPN
jgi:hypothetical protein